MQTETDRLDLLKAKIPLAVVEKYDTGMTFDEPVVVKDEEIPKVVEDLPKPELIDVPPKVEDPKAEDVDINALCYVNAISDDTVKRLKNEYITHTKRRMMMYPSYLG